MNGTETMSVFTQALIYSCIAFSIVFIVLGGLTLVIYAMRILTGNSSSGSSGPSGSSKSAAETAKAAPVASNVGPAQASAPNVKGRHVAAITAAIMALTNGRGRILSVTPSSGGRVISSDATRTWRTAAVIQAVGRRLAPSWKR